MEFKMTPHVIERTSELLVRNGTAGPTTGWEGYVEKFKSLRKGTAEAVLDLAVILVEAEGNLSKKDFGSFCEKAGIAKGQSYHKKLRTIGKNASRLRPHLRLLPHCWTTIYKLAQMQTGKFDELVASGGLSPGMTARDIGKFLGAPSNGEGVTEASTTKDAARRVVISFGKLDVDAKRRVAAEILELARGLPASDTGWDATASDPLNIAA